MSSEINPRRGFPPACRQAGKCGRAFQGSIDDIRRYIIEEIVTKIDKLIYGGYGLGRVFDKAIFVPKVIPDETVRVKITKDKGDYYFGELVEIIKPAKERIDAPCPYFNHCGGCDYQHIKYQSQLSFKENIFFETIKRVGGLNEIPINPIIPSPEPFHYRLKAQLKTSRTGERVNLGYFKKDSHSFIPIEECIICHKKINALINVLLKLSEQNLLYHLDEIEIIYSKLTDKLLLSLSENKINKNRLENLYSIIKKRINEITGVLSLKKTKVDCVGKNFIEERVKDIDYRVTSESFFQVNYSLHELLVNQIMKLVSPRKKDNILDIYSGVGTFSLPIALKANYVYGIDESESSIRDALYNQKSNKIKNCEFLKAKAEDCLIALKNKKVTCNTVLINPPRSGCSEKVKKSIISFNPLNIIYLSCNPSTLGRDLSFFIRSGYEIKSIQPIDQFPQTYHIEALAKLEKSKQIKV